MVEKEWFTNFLTYIDSKEESNGKPAKHPGKINNGKLLSSSSMNGYTPTIESSMKQEEKGDTDSSSSYDNNSNEDGRQQRRRKWEGMVKQKREDELLGGNSKTANPVEIRSELRNGVDYELVGKETWAFLSTNFSCDVELPQQQQLNHQQPESEAGYSDMDAGSSVAVAHSASSVMSDEGGSSKSDSGDDLVS